MSDQALLVVTIAALCLSSAEFAASVVHLWEKRTEFKRSELGGGFNRTELGGRLRLLSYSVVSAALVIFATLLLLYAGNEHAVLILLVCFCAIGIIPQGFHLILCYKTYFPGYPWVVGAMVICFVMELGLSIATGFLTTQKAILYVLLTVFGVEYFLFVLIYLIIYHKRRESSVGSNADLVWSMTICSIIIVAISTSLALYCSSIVDRTTCLLILVSATLTRMLRPIGVGTLRILKLIWPTLGKKMFALSSVTESNGDFSA